MEFLQRSAAATFSNIERTKREFQTRNLHTARYLYDKIKYTSELRCLRLVQCQAILFSGFQDEPHNVNSGILKSNLEEGTLL